MPGLSVKYKRFRGEQHRLRPDSLAASCLVRDLNIKHRQNYERTNCSRSCEEMGLSSLREICNDQLHAKHSSQKRATTLSTRYL